MWKFKPGKDIVGLPLVSNLLICVSLVSVLVLSVSVLSGCSQSSVPPEDVPPQQPSSLQVSADLSSGESSNETPIEFEVVEEIFDGNLLSLVLGIDPRVPISSEMITVRLLLYGSGAKIGESSFLLSQLRRVNSLEPIGPSHLDSHRRESVLVQQSIPQDATDYQIEVAWKPEGASQESPEETGEVLRLAEVRELPMMCTNQCLVPFSVELALINPFPQPITQLRFASWFGLPGEDQVPSDRGTFSLETLVIGPREELAINVRLKTPLPYPLYAKGYRPQVELDSFEFLSGDR